MNTVPAKKIRWGRLMSRQISCGAHNSTLAGAFPHFDGENAHLTDHALALTKRAAAKVNEDLGLCLKRKRAPFGRRRMKYWQDS